MKEKAAGASMKFSAAKTGKHVAAKAGTAQNPFPKVA